MSAGHVVINGKKYSMKSMGEQPAVTRMVDGFVGKTAAKDIPMQPVQRTEAPKAAQRSVSVTSKKTAVNKSQTLNRKAVKKPATSTSKQATITRPSLNPPKHRVDRAAATPKSPHIGKFSAAPAVAVKHTNLAPKPEPTNTPALSAPPAAKPRTTQKETVFSRHIDNAPENIPAPEKKKRRLKAHAVAPLAVFGLFVAGFFAYSSIPSVSMLVAANRAGFNAKLPDSPSGFSVAGPIQYETGKVAVNYKSNTDSRQLSLFQQPSSLDSASLSSGFLDSKGIEYDTQEINGKTVFIYEGNKATWVSQGIWYNLEGESNFSESQILKLADSL